MKKAIYYLFASACFGLWVLNLIKLFGENTPSMAAARALGVVILPLGTALGLI